MKKVLKEVSYKGEAVGNVEVSVYENLSEAVSALTEETALAYVNRVTAVVEMDNFRRKHIKRPPSLRDIASKLKSNPELLAEVQEKLG